MLESQQRSEVKLSHAIREGAKLKPAGIWKKTHKGGTNSCALGAAADHVGCVIEDGSDKALLEFFPQLADQVPAFEEFQAGTLQRLVCQLNQGGRSRETIADVVEGLGY